MPGYWWGVATPFIALVVGYLLFRMIAWLSWWGQSPSRRLGRGRIHDFDSKIDGKWYLCSRHTHYWPAGTPWWLVHALEPARVWLCLRSPDRAPAGSTRRSDRADSADD